MTQEGKTYVSPLLIRKFTHLVLFCRKAKTQAEEAEQHKLEMETLAERLIEANKRGDVAEKGFENHKIIERASIHSICSKLGRISY